MTRLILTVYLDVDVGTIQRIEKGEQNFSIDILFKILESLNVSVEELLGDLGE